MTPTEVVVTGTNPGTHPVLESWEWTIPAYLFIGGLVAGLMIFGGVIRLRAEHRLPKAIVLLDWLGLPILGAGLVLLWLDLANRWNAWRFFTTFRWTSAMSWGSWILLVTGIVLTLRLAARAQGAAGRIRLLGRVRPLLRWAGRVVDRFQTAVDVATIVLGIALGLYTGVLLSQIAARPLWDSAFLAPLFLVSGIATGGAFLCLFLDGRQHRLLAPVSIGACGVEIALLTGYLVTAGVGFVTGDPAAELLLTGDYAPAFWGLVVGAGLIVPLLIEITELVRRHVPALLARTAPTLKLVGGAALRFVVVFAGLETVL
ncbi:MAG: NrfD/PsrC family molybdoenzyme membrane anchor subunit [Acidimicrobiia bacterium]|nr:NrfD/PsrC family molybdoenzyme membrane anchor subunit [Acidimicrobiia bacterium]